MNRERLRERLGGRVVVSSHPRLLEKICEVSEDPASSSQEVAAAIARDPASTARILRNVNTHFALPDKVVTIERACQVLGMRRVRGLLRKVPTYHNAHFDMRRLIRHSVTTAEVCAHMARALPALGVDPSELWVHGLLHDIGQFPMVEGIGAEYHELWKRSHDARADLARLERERFGFSHNELGAMLVKRWEFPEELVRSVRFHHNERRLAEVFSHASAVLVANLVAEEAGRTSESRLLRKIPGPVATTLGLTRAHLSELLAAASERLAA